MTLNAILFAVVLVAALGLFARSAARLIGYLRLGKKENRFTEPGRRLGRVLTVAFGQTKLLREPFAGLLHFLIGKRGINGIDVDGPHIRHGQFK